MNELVTELYGVAYCLPSENSEWVERQGNTVPMNACTRAGDEIERLTAENERLREAIRGLVTAFDDDAESFGSSSAMDRARGMIDHQQSPPMKADGTPCDPNLTSQAAFRKMYE